MSTLLNGVSIHAKSLVALTEFVNRESVVLNNTNPKFKLSNSQALEYVAKLSGYNTYKGFKVGNGVSKFTPDELQNNFEAIFLKQFKSDDQVALSRLKQIHGLYLFSQRWVLDQIADTMTALALSFVKVSKWNKISALYLQKNINASPKFADGGFKPQLELSHLFTANLLGHITEPQDDEYDINDHDVSELFVDIPKDWSEEVVSSYNWMAGSCFVFSNQDDCNITRIVQYLLDVANGRTIEGEDRSNKFADISPRIQAEMGVLGNMAAIDTVKFYKEQNVNFGVIHNVPNYLLVGDTCRFLMEQLPKLNSAITGQDHWAVSYCPENMGINLWNDLLIDFYNAALDYMQIIFEDIVENHRFIFQNVYFDRGSVLCYVGDGSFKVRWKDGIADLNASELSMLLTYMIVNQVVHKESTPFNNYMWVYYQNLILSALQNGHSGIRQPRLLSQIIFGG